MTRTVKDAIRELVDEAADNVFREDVEEVVQEFGYTVKKDGIRLRDDKLFLDLADADGWGNETRSITIEFNEEVNA